MSTKTVIQHYLQLVYIFGLLQCFLSTAGLLSSYSGKWENPEFLKNYLQDKKNHVKCFG
jgi:hypothetical protein